jgi:hypothetical protein
MRPLYNTRAQRVSLSEEASQANLGLSIFLLLTAEVFGGYSTLIRSYWNTRFPKLITIDS